MSGGASAALVGVLFVSSALGSPMELGTSRPLSAEISRSTLPGVVLVEVEIRGGYSSRADLEFLLRGDGTLQIREFTRMEESSGPESRVQILEQEEVDAIMNPVVESGLIGQTTLSLLEVIRKHHPSIRELISGSDCERTRLAIHLLRSVEGSASPVPVETELDLECVMQYPRAYAGIPAPLAAASLVSRLRSAYREEFSR